MRRIRELSRQHPRYGYGRITALHRREGVAVNSKRVHRLWRQAGLQVPRRQRRRVAAGKNGTVRLRHTYRNQVWSYDFLIDATEGSGRPSSCLSSTGTRENAWRSCGVLDREPGGDRVPRPADCRAGCSSVHVECTP
ncbi:MAG: IS3 family transposase [Pseudomonadota bacterium]